MFLKQRQEALLIVSHDHDLKASQVLSAWLGNSQELLMSLRGKTEKAGT